MAASFVASASGASGTTSTLTASATVPGTVADGDLALVVAAIERSSVFVSVAGPTAGYTSVSNAVLSTDGAYDIGWKRITSADLGGSFQASVSSGRRMSIGVMFFRGVQDPIFTVGSVSSGLSIVCSNVTPTDANSMTAALAAVCSPVANFQKTFASGGSWTEQLEAGSVSTTNANAYSYGATQLISGGAGTPVTGDTITITNSGSARYIGASVVMSPVTSSTVPAGWDEVRLFTVST